MYASNFERRKKQNMHIIFIDKCTSSALQVVLLWWYTVTELEFVTVISAFFNILTNHLLIPILTTMWILSVLM